MVGRKRVVDSVAKGLNDAHRPCKSCVRAHANLIANLVKRGKPFPAHPDCVYDGDSPGAYDANQTVDLNDKKDLEDKLLLKSPPLVVDPAPQRKSQSSRSEICLIL
ncbi:hypothetical protein FRC12_003977 [Ceratobasidium sp. 428]|nr:hypothetical protein FRC12_003977 [Ceratobasidium sp. 428]